MSALNKKAETVKVQNQAGVLVNQISAQKQLTRLSLANMLWEDQFYIDGKSTVDIIDSLIPKVKPQFVADLAKTARTKFKLRHLPLALMNGLAKQGTLKANMLVDVINRPDEMGEFLSNYWKDGKTPVSNQVKKGLAQAFSKFNEYQLAKWDKNSAKVSIRDVMFLTHPKPANKEQEDLFKRVANKQLATPDTHETQLSAGADKKETFMRLMAEGKLGALAFLRNLRGMLEAGVPEKAIRDYAKTVKTEMVLPFRFLAAAKHAPTLEDMLEEMMLNSLDSHEKLKGKTILLVDISGSMFGAKVSAKSELDRFDAASSLAILCREICESVEVYTFSDQCVRVPNRRGMALKEAMLKSQRVSGTALYSALKQVPKDADRIIVFTDEQSTDTGRISKLAKNQYVINVAAYQNGINHGAWTTITGFSEAVIDYIQALENEDSH